MQCGMNYMEVLSELNTNFKELLMVNEMHPFKTSKYLTCTVNSEIFASIAKFGKKKKLAK